MDFSTLNLRSNKPKNLFYIYRPSYKTHLSGNLTAKWKTSGLHFNQSTPQKFWIHIHMQSKVDKINTVINELVNKTPLRF